VDESYHPREATFDSSPVLLIGAELLPGKITVKGGAEVLPGKISVKGLPRKAGTCRRRALDGDLSR